jgi:hypothetical protein
MNEICIGPRTQAIGLGAVVAAIVGAVVAQLPEIRRYIKISTM